MSTQFRLKLPSSIDYKDILLKNGTCCNGYTAIPGGSFDSYYDCYNKGFYFIHATGDTVCGDQTLAQSDAPNNLSINDQTFWYWWYVPVAPNNWPWGKEFNNASTNTRFEQFKQEYKGIFGFGHTSGIGFTLSGRPQSQSSSDSSSINYWNSPLTETTYKDPNFLIKNHTWGTNNNNPKWGNDWNEESGSNNGYSMPGSTGFKFHWDPIPQGMMPFVNDSDLTDSVIDPLYVNTATQLFTDKFRVWFGFDSDVPLDGSDSNKRAVQWGGETAGFTWKRFIKLQDWFNPAGASLNPWSLENWYRWGCRKFYFHSPFGRVQAGKLQGLVYEVDQFLNARDGLTINGETQNSAMPWLTTDFTVVFKALTTGQQGSLDQSTWDSWTTGPNAWFNPSEPIDLIVYIGSLAKSNFGLQYEKYIQRWNQMLPDQVDQRLRDSVQPIIDAGCGIAFDAIVDAPGPIAGDYIPTNQQSIDLQTSWWNFWTWLKTETNKRYIESHPFRRTLLNGTTIDNPYLGESVVADDDWSNSLLSDIPHMTSEMSGVTFIRTFFNTGQNFTPLLKIDQDGDIINERYAFLHELTTGVTWTEVENDAGALIRRELRLTGPTIDNYYWYDLIGPVVSYHFLEKQNTREETNPDGNNTKNEFMVNNQAIQIISKQQNEISGNHLKQFGALYPSKDKFIQYIAQEIENKQTNIDITSSATGITYQLMDLRRLKFAHPFSKRMFNPRHHEYRISNAKVAAYWYSLLSPDGFTGIGPRNQSQRVNSPWQDNMADTTAQSIKIYLQKLSDLGITLSYLVLDDEYLNQAFLPGSGLGDHSEYVVQSIDGQDPQKIYIPDKELPLPGIKGHLTFNGSIPSFPESTAGAPDGWSFYTTTGTTWWNGEYYNTYKNPNGNSIRNILNDPRWHTQGLTHLNGITLGALFTKRYNDLRSAWIASFSGTSFSSDISESTIPKINDIINFFSGWSGQYIKGTTHEIEKIDGGFTLYRSPSGETRTWLPATAWTSNAWPITTIKIDNTRIDGFNVTWAPYGGTLGVRTLHNLSSQIQWNDFNSNHFFKDQFMTKPSIIDSGNAWAWSLQHVFRPAWDCLIGDIQISQYSFDAFSVKSTQGLTAYPNGITYSHYDCYDLNAEESIYLVRSNAAELTYRLSGKNSTHSPVFYFNFGNLNILFPSFADIFLASDDSSKLVKLNDDWPLRLGYVKSATVPLEKYKIYHLAGTPVVGLNGITIDPPQSGITYQLARWPSNEFVGIGGPTFTQADVKNLQVRHKINQANTYARLLVHLQLLRGIMRSDPKGHVKLFPWIDTPQNIEDYKTEQIHHLILHGAKALLLFQSNADFPVRSCLILEKILKDVNTMTGGGQLVPLGKFDINGTTWAESGSTGSNGNTVKMDQLVLEDSLEDYILTGAKVTTGPFTGRHIWRITPSPVKINWTGDVNSSLMRKGNLTIVVNGITHEQFIGDITKSDIQRSPGIYVVTNNNITPTIEFINPPTTDQG